VFNMSKNAASQQVEFILKLKQTTVWETPSKMMTQLMSGGPLKMVDQLTALKGLLVDSYHMQLTPLLTDKAGVHSFKVHMALDRWASFRKACEPNALILGLVPILASAFNNDLEKVQSRRLHCHFPIVSRVA